MLPPFKNESFTDFSSERNAALFREALSNVESQLGREYPLIIGGSRYTTGDLLTSPNPSNYEEVVGQVHKASVELADKAIEEATAAFKEWRNVDPVTRARYLLNVASIMRKRKMELAAWMVLEVGKSWAEADGDVAEAIDFAEFYAREMIRYSREQPLTPLEGEENELFYIPLGVGVIIPPWNFPLAIMAGMTLASVVTGNTVILKPSSDSPVIAAKFMEILEEASLPPGVVNFLPGSGSRIGDYLVGDARTRFIAFTGSREVGLHINELAAKTAEGQLWIKRVVAEMGGKDTIIIDETANLDAAVEGAVVSAFGFSGQKCSACSRLVVVDQVYDEVMERVARRTAAIKVGPVKDQGNWMGPVASKSAYESILNYIEVGKGEGQVIAGGDRLQSGNGGWFIQPTVIGEVDSRARISQEEIFGPVLATFRAGDFESALEMANNTQFGLTGALFSNDRRRLEQARRDFHVGNLYLNRKCTGALVGVHPFGGFNMSGTDSKAGGRDYLLLFMQAKSVSEKL
ncbi:MAG TPA: L-glutamate gamma-semialdehyde dehydrogenase [Blastocatellia bacterium]|jgi:1-pyrroline-5-carboxylate dehydrogenase|nr:L-glutamate gamma-semialdehyde dehydrogenase [Blastocatellia bacterium]